MRSAHNSARKALTAHVSGNKGRHVARSSVRWRLAAAISGESANKVMSASSCLARNSNVAGMGIFSRASIFPA